MVAEVVQPSASVLDAPFFNDIEEILAATETISYRALALDHPDENETNISESAKIEFAPRIRSGSFADKGPRRCMEDEHITIDDLSSYFGSLYQFPVPTAFYGVFDGHGGAEAATYVKENATRFFFNVPQTRVVDEFFLSEVEVSIRKGFLMADLALAEDSRISTSAGTTALTAFVFENTLMVANAGDCRAVLSRKGVAVDVSCDHRPTNPSEKRRVEESGGYVDDGYLNGVLAVSRALGDWDVKLAGASPSLLIAEPEVNIITLNEDDEFLIVACDGVWDVMSSQHAVNVARRQLSRHGDPSRCARDVAMEALRCQTFDNLTVIVVCFSCEDLIGTEMGTGTGVGKGRALSSDAICRLQSLLDGNSNY